jgi:hypothetical protein
MKMRPPQDEMIGTDGDALMARDVNAFGLDGFGRPVGMSPLWGAVVGTGVGTVGAVAARQFAPVSWAKWSEAIGFGLSALASGVMIAFKGTRAAGWTGLASAFLNNGLRQIELMLFMPAASVPAAGWGRFGDVVIEPTQALMGNGMGLVDIEPEQALFGATHDTGDMPMLVGANLAAASDHVQLVGGPALAQFAGHWGATTIPG